MSNKWLEKFYPRNSLVARISYATALVTVVLSVVLGYYAGAMSRAQIEKDLGKTFLSRSQHVVDVLDRGMFERYREVQIVASLDDIRNPLVSVDKKRAILEKLQTTFDAYAWVGICDADGKGLVGTGKYLEGKDLSQRPWCNKGREGPYAGDVHDALLLAKILPNPSGENFYLLDVAAPVTDANGILQGVLCGHIYWKWAEAELAGKNDEGIDVLLLSRDGLVLSGPEPARAEMSKLAPAIWSRLSATPHAHDAFLETWPSGKQYLIGHAHDVGYRDYPGLGWTVLVRQDADIAFAPARALQQRILLLGAALGVLFTLIGAWLARRIAQPISEIARAADRVAAGALDYSVPVVAGNDEVARLSSSIHTMVNSLAWEIMERKCAEEELKLAATVFANNSEAVVITDAHNNIIRVNDAFTRITGYADTDVIGCNPRMFASGQNSKGFYQRLWRDLLQNNGWSGEIWNKRKSGEVYPVWLILSLVHDDAGNISNYIAIYSDISERKQAEQRMEFLASHDALTQLPNRYLFTDRFNQALATAQRKKTKLALLFIDLDYFKNINDSLGHDVGDVLLEQVARRMSHCMRRSDTLARFGGDEFMAFLQDIQSENGAARMAEKLLASFERPFEVGVHLLSISPSIGVSLYPEDATDSVALMRNADLAMYRAKAAGRRAIEFYRPELTLSINERLQLEMQLRHALERRELFLVYQPQVDVLTAKVIGVEALLRWQHPALGLIAPMRFIPVAEESGLIVEIGDWVLRQACLQIKAWQQQGLRLVPVAVNVSGVQFKRPDFVARVTAALHEMQVDARWIEIEITESVLMELGENSLTVMNALKALNLRLSLDDFGTGFSSLSRLKTFPLDVLKVDQGFVRDITTDANDAAIVRAVLGMAHEMGIHVVAEGVETREQLDFLEKLRCESYQGYLFSRPVPPEQIAQYLLMES